MCACEEFLCRESAFQGEARREGKAVTRAEACQSHADSGEDDELKALPAISLLASGV